LRSLLDRSASRANGYELSRWRPDIDPDPGALLVRPPADDLLSGSASADAARLRRLPLMSAVIFRRFP
jgi:hypothetical protein